MKTRTKKSAAPRNAPSRALHTLQDLTPDPQNANRGTKRGRTMLDSSLREHGAGRSILVDKRGQVIAGNKTLEHAKALGLPMRVVKTRGDRLVVVQREDLDATTDPTAKALAIADNRIAQVDLDWDVEVLEQLRGEGVNLSNLWTEDELVRFLSKSGDDAPDEVEAKEQWAVLVLCESEQAQQKLIARMQKDGLECRALMS